MPAESGTWAARSGTASDMITGVTISSRTVINIINSKLQEIEPLLVLYAEKKQ